MLGKIGEGVVISHQFPPAIWRHLGVPLLFRCAKTLVEILKTFLEIGVVCRIEFAELLREPAGNSSAIVWIQPVVRVTERVHIAHGAGYNPSWNFQDLCKLRSVKIAVRADLNSAIAALSDKRRQPSDLELQTDHDQQICLP